MECTTGLDCKWRITAVVFDENIGAIIHSEWNDGFFDVFYSAHIHNHFFARICCRRNSRCIKIDCVIIYLLTIIWLEKYVHIHKHNRTHVFITMDTQECYVNGTKYLIDQFMENIELVQQYQQGLVKLCTEHGDELIFCNGTVVKPYFRKLHIEDNPMTDWHIDWQKEFEGYTEKTYKCDGMHKNYRRTDVDLNETHVIEFQNSRINNENVAKRMEDYAKVSKEIIWVINGNNSVTVTDLTNWNRILLDFSAEKWKYENFIAYDFVYLDVGGLVHKFSPKMVKSGMIDVQPPISKLEFCNRLKNGLQLFDDVKIIQANVIVKQQGAGNGKTFSATNLLSESYDGNGDKFHHYDTFLYLTKQHSAKDVTYNEFIEKKDGKYALKSELLSENFNLTYPSKFKNDGDGNKKDKKIRIELQHKITNKKHKIIIATIDSFIYALNTGTVNGLDMFEEYVRNIITDGINCKKNGYVKYTDGIMANKRLLIVGDEMQDLEKGYVEAILRLCVEKYVDFYIVGDKMQSIKTAENSFTYLSNATLPDTINLIRPNPNNRVRRFGGETFINFVNKLIPFESYGLPKIEQAENCKANSVDSDLTIFVGNKIYATATDECLINMEVQAIMNYYEAEVNENNYKPNDFLIVTPFTTHNPLIEALNLSIREFWKNRMHNDKYTCFSYFHKSEDGCTIDLKDSADATRIVSIHTSKGDGRNVVFVIGITEDALKIYSGESNNLVYDSLLHVAITRMKKRLYIRFENNNDDICRKLMGCDVSSSTSPYVEFSKRVDISKLINRETRDIYKLCYEKIISHTNYTVFPNSNTDSINEINKKNDKQIIDLKHHLIRRVSMHILFSIAISNTAVQYNKANAKKFLSQQFFAVLTNCRDYDLKRCYNAVEYNNALYNTNLNIPMLVYKNGEYAEISGEITNMIKGNKLTINKLIGRKEITEFEIMQSMCLQYMMEASEHKMQGILPIADLFDIVNLYQKSSPEEQNRHITSHHDKTVKINNIQQKIHEIYPRLRWLWKKRDDFGGEGDCIILYNRHEYIGYDDNTVIICKICPQFNQLNYNKIIFESIFDIFVLKYHKKYENNDAYYNGKKIIVCIITLDLDEPYYVDFGDMIENNKQFILCMMRNMLVSSFSIKNKGIYLLYSHFRNKHKNKNAYTAISSIVDEINNLCKVEKHQFPNYVADFFGSIKTEVAGAKTCGNDVLKKYDNQECFITGINDCMNFSINYFLRIDDEDIELHNKFA